MTPDGVRIENPAFDVTPAKYITAIIPERGVLHPPYPESIAEVTTERASGAGRKCIRSSQVAQEL